MLRMFSQHWSKSSHQPTTKNTAHFSSSSIKLPKDFNLLTAQTTYQAVTHLAAIKGKKSEEIKTKYPQLLEHFFHGKIAYTLQYKSPEEVIKNGGLLSRKDLWVSNTRSGYNDGCICFSLLPEVTAIFSRGSIHSSSTKKTSKPYIYAFPLTGNFFIPGSQWREIISPGAFPLTRFWMCRELLDIDHQNKIHLGPIQGHIGKMDIIHGERLEAYLQNKLVKPNEIDFGEDFPLEFDINDTDESAKFQKAVKEHYDAIANQPTPRP
ncbi:hypothetical protein [Aquicella lusitana]|uniref:Uncharacterized protein n=1 Tax=Aquicella lusitana TaxID=254246 RepID=A0A370G5I7_9COXI|nr:hypothetical protein [Aquicella lusitana]RDI39072.1 hypothetical protein C8D86_12928 [Aquicella lusitana]VVC73679.1 hypothetical protein AQULUS_14260 [Aquicella lusitana]